LPETFFKADTEVEAIIGKTELVIKVIKSLSESATVSELEFGNSSDKK